MTRTMGEVMTRDPIEVQHDQTLEEAAEIMKANRVRHLVVCDRGRPCGVLSERALYRFEAKKRASPGVVAVAEAMAPDPVEAGPDEPLANVAARMADRGADAALVMQGGSLVGIFTTTDALRLLAAER